MESAINVLVSKFKVYAGSEGSSDTLSRDEFYKLVKAELSNFVTVKLQKKPGRLRLQSDSSGCHIGLDRLDPIIN
ncbi:protein S100-A11-like isoform X2 [Cynoglossus semilaevis]|uniref:protein S100-A11-like isoform X2 n=1 Tax=Cynoglossus semilaevis TaxID=244447 RepID=UPI000D62A05D|nr:protein S100-A11-like isoform X2 [Cynoglossus semilaevis]